MIPLIELSRQFGSIKAELLSEFERVIEDGQYILGPRVLALEEKVASRLNAKHAIGVANGTDALMLTLLAMGIGPGDEIITTPFTFIASAEAASQVGATPVFADIDPETYNLDPREVERRITKRTKAIIPVHLFGQPAEMDPLMDIAERHGIRVIEDACQAFGAKYKGRPAGGLADAACFSFFPTKNLGTLGDGGLIATSDDQLAERIRKLRQHGSKIKYYHQMIGYNSRLDEIHAAALLLCLRYIDQWNEQRRRLADRYRDGLRSSSDILIRDAKPSVEHIYHLFCVECERRDELMNWLKTKGIQSGVYYPVPLHLQHVYRSLGYKEGAYPIAEAAAKKLLAIPMSPFLTEAEQQHIIQAILDFGGAGNAP